MTTPERVLRPDILALRAYPVPASAGMIKLDAMENPWRLPPDLAAEVGRIAAGAELNRYPDPAAPALKARLREVMHIPERCDLLLGNGSDELIERLIQSVAREGAVVMSPEPTFVMYRVSSAINRVRHVGVDLEADFALDPARFIAEMERHRPALVFLAWPNNPTGNLFSEDAVARIIRAAPGLVVIDEAYQVFARRSFLPRLAEFPNLLVLRTVSKLGLAGLRLGYAVAHPRWIGALEKLRGPYNVGVLTQAIGERLLAHHDLFEAQAARILAERDRVAAALRGGRFAGAGVSVFPGEANFVLARVPRAARVFEALCSRGILAKCLDGAHPLLADCLRFTAGTPEENDALLAALADIIAPARIAAAS